VTATSFYIQVVRALEEIEAPYMIVGAFAGLAYGINRATFDVDILVDLREQDFETLAARFPSPRYYADPEMMRNSTRDGIMFNIIDSEEGVKADLVPLTREPEYQFAFARRVRQSLQDEAGTIFDAWCAQPADIIVGKLKAWTEGRSAKHPSDILSIMHFSISGLGSRPIDVDYISVQAARMGLETLKLWQELLARARRESRSANKE
jgi:hypothetical protein